MKKILLASLACTTLISTSALAVIGGAYGEIGFGSSAVGVTVDDTTDASNSNFLIRGGVGYKAHFAKTTPLFWGVDAHLNSYAAEFASADAAVMIGGDLSKYLALYFKVGAEYTLNDAIYQNDHIQYSVTGNKTHLKAGVGLNYCISKNAALALEINGTDLGDASTLGTEVSFVRADVSLGLQYKF